MVELGNIVHVPHNAEEAIVEAERVFLELNTRTQIHISKDQATALLETEGKSWTVEFEMRGRDVDEAYYGFPVAVMKPRFHTGAFKCNIGASDKLPKCACCGRFILNKRNWKGEEDK